MTTTITRGADTRLLTTADLADRWQVSTGHLANMRSERRGPAHVKLGMAVRYRLSDVEAHEAEHLAVPA